jgi:hypothetical protein
MRRSHDPPQAISPWRLHSHRLERKNPFRTPGKIDKPLR